MLTVLALVLLISCQEKPPPHPGGESGGQDSHPASDSSPGDSTPKGDSSDSSPKDSDSAHSGQDSHPDTEEEIFWRSSTRSDYVQISTGPYASCALDSSGQIECWGKSSLSKLFTGIPVSQGPFTQVTVGTAHACALRQDGIPVCWGAYSSSLSGELDPQKEEILYITASSGYLCALAKNGDKLTWTAPDSLTITTGKHKAVDGGEAGCCAILSTGKVACQGINQTPRPEDNVIVSQISVSWADCFACGLRANGEIVCWGHEGDGYCSRTKNPGGYAPKKTGYIQVSCGAIHSCAIDREGHVDCWGTAGYYEDPTREPPLFFQQIEAGYLTTCGLDLKGQIHCWGDNDQGQTTPP